MIPDVTSQIHTELGDLAADAKQRVLEYVRALKRTGTGMTADALKKHIGCIDPADGQAMREAIEAGCEQVDLNEW